MASRLKTIFFILVLSISVFSGTPLQSGDMGMKESVCPMKCCKKSVKSQEQQKQNQKFLCRVMVCSQNLPTSTSTVPQVNFVPVIIASETVSLFEILFSTTPKENLKIDYDHPDPSFQPKYIQHQRIIV